MDSEEMIKTLEETKKMFEEGDKYRLEIGLSKEHPFHLFVYPWLYDMIKKEHYKEIDENDIYYDGCYGWIKVIKVEEPKLEGKYTFNDDGTITKTNETPNSIQNKNKENFKKFVERKGKK